MVPYNKIYGLNSENYKRADLEESIKKHWWKYLIGLGLAGGAGYLAYKAFFDKSKGGTKQQDSAAQQSEAQGDTFNIYKLLNLDTKGIEEQHWSKINEAISEAIEELEKEHKNDPHFHSLLGNIKFVAQKANSKYDTNHILSIAQEALRNMSDIVNGENVPPHFKELYELIISQDAASKAYEKVKNMFKEHHIKLIADKIKQKIHNYKDLKNIIGDEKYSHYPNAIIKTVLGAAFINHYVTEQLKHMVNDKHREYVTNFLNAHIPLFVKFGGNQGKIFSRIILANEKKSSFIKRKLRK